MAPAAPQPTSLARELESVLRALPNLSDCIAVRTKHDLASRPAQQDAALARSHVAARLRSEEIEAAVKAKRAELEETLIRIEVAAPRPLP